MSVSLFRVVFLPAFVFFSFSSLAIYDLQTKEESFPKNVEGKNWLLVSQGCHSCSQVLSELKGFCSGKKPSSSKIGFFAIGDNPSALLKKLDGFVSDYEIFAGTPGEFYQAYNLQGTPGLKPKGQNKKPVMGKSQILSALKEDTDFCLQEKPVPSNKKEKAAVKHKS